MSELINVSSKQSDFRWRLLASVSGAALMIASASTLSLAADGVDRPAVWIELDGQLDQMSAPDQPFAPPYVANLPGNFFSPLNIQKSSKYAIDSEGALSFTPPDTDWVFSASVRFGRSTSARTEHQQTPNAKVAVPQFKIPFGTGYKYIGNFDFYPTNQKFEGVNATRRETHTVLDFQAGKDVGLGLFGKRGSSIISAGVRFAQFTSHSHISMGAAPDINYSAGPINSFAAYKQFKYHHYTRSHHHFYSAQLDAQRSFHGIGPSVSWKGSLPVIGAPDRGEISLDWGLNGAVLFGRQKVQGYHKSMTRTDYISGRFFTGSRAGDADRIGRWPLVGTHTVHHTGSIDRMRSVVVPNVGALTGFSFRYSDARVSFGYRTDFFFGAMDGGIDKHKSETLGFHGPFASVSVGLGG